jgi:hypothetical protein
VFHQDFQHDAPDIKRDIWESPHWQPHNNPAFYGRTGIRNPNDFPGPDGLVPCTAQNGADLRLSTYNPKAPNHDTFLGSDISTKQAWGANGETVKFEATVQCPTMPGGAVTSLFPYNLITKQPPNPGDLRNEIDFEFASNHWSESPPTLNTNVCGSQNGGGTGIVGVKSADGVNFQNFNTFSIEFNPSNAAGFINWLVNRERKYQWMDYPNPHFPHPQLSGGMRLHLNFWAPAADWAWAYNQNLKPSSSAPGQEWHYYVKNASVYYWEDEKGALRAPLGF